MRKVSNKQLYLRLNLKPYFMNKFKLFAFLLVSITITSCSSDGGGSSVTDSFTYKANGVDIPVPIITAIRHEDFIEILAQNSDGRSMYLFFNKYGQLSRASSTAVSTDPFNNKNSAVDFSLNNFNLELVELDESNKIVKVNYSGKLFDDEYDLANSPFTNVEGSATVHYTETAPAIPGLSITATIGGTSWRAVKSSLTNNGAIQNVVIDENSDDAYKISIYLDQTNTTTGTYTFSGTSGNNKVTLSKYDPVTNTYIDYTCSGAFALNQKDTDGLGNTLISGTFTFSAVPSGGGATIQVTNGDFKEYYNW